MIYPLYMGSPEDRARISKYCFKDAQLPLDIINNQMVIVNSIAMCRVVGVPFKWLLEKGQQAKTQSVILREIANADEQGTFYVLPTKSPDKRPYQGAIVVKPKKGLYLVPIGVLDFSSLYPSIMIAYNLCYSTFIWVKDAPSLGLKEDDYRIPPNTDGTFAFVKQHKKQGVLPRILAKILAERRVANKKKEAAQEAGNKELEDIYNALQLAFKITANSIYGYTSANKLSFTYIAESVTAYGRYLITFTSESIMNRFNTRTPDVQKCLSEGIDPNWEDEERNPLFFYEADSDIVYGDTDSVMINFGDVSVARCQQLAREASAFMKPQYVAPNNCIFEKAYYPYLLIEKKRYAGLFWTRADKPDKTDYKGIEVVRRDWTTLCTEVLTKGLEQILVHKSVQGLIDAVHAACSDVLNDRIDISKLILTKGYTKTMDEYKSKGKTLPVHIALVERALKRDPATAPAVGDRVSYVITDGLKRHKGKKGWKDTSVAERAEDPLYVMENNVPIDGMWYIQNQLVKPCVRLFQAALCVTQEEKKELQDDYYEKNPEMTTAYKKLFTGNHMNRRIKTIRAAEPGKMTAFIVKMPTCFICHVVAKKRPDGTFEPTCNGETCQKAVNRDEYVQKVSSAKETLEKHQQICVTCQKGMPYEDILCENKICKNWFQRFKAKKDFNDACKKLSRFSIN